MTEKSGKGYCNFGSVPWLGQDDNTIKFDSGLVVSISRRYKFCILYFIKNNNINYKILFFY